MSIMTAVNAWNDIEKFKEELHTYPDEVLDKIKQMIVDEFDIRVQLKIENNNFAEVLQEEYELGRYDGVRAYRARTGTDLKVAFELFSRKMRKLSK